MQKLPGYFPLFLLLSLLSISSHCFQLGLYYISDNRAGPSNLGNVISQILLCKQITPDFNQEELCSITKDSQEIARILAEMQEYMPQHETYLGKYRNKNLDIGLYVTFVGMITSLGFNISNFAVEVHI